MWSANRDNGTSVNTHASDLHSGIVQSTWAFTDSLQSFSTVPEPSSLALAGLGVAGLLGAILRRATRLANEILSGVLAQEFRSRACIFRLWKCASVC